MSLINNFYRKVSSDFKSSTLDFKLETYYLCVTFDCSKILGRIKVSTPYQYLIEFDSFWNIDYVEVLKIYDLKSTNKLESTFLVLCNYELYVSEIVYQYYFNFTA